MGLKLSEYGDLHKLVDQLKKPFNRRDTEWINRRRIRFRRMDKELKALPLNPHIADQALMIYQSEVPNQEVHKRVKRLVANKPRFEVVVYDTEPKSQQVGQDIEDGVKALYKWMNRGKVDFDWQVTQFQQGDGLGIGKLEWVPGHGDALAYYENDRIVESDEEEDEEELEDDDREMRKGRNQARREYRSELDSQDVEAPDREAKAYSKVTDKVLRSELPPIRLLSVDPVSCYWWEDGDGIEVIAEVGKRALNPLLSALKNYGVKLSEDGSRLFVPENSTDVAGPTMPSTSLPYDFGQMVDFIEIRTRDEIAILIDHPKITAKAGESAKEEGSRGVVLRFDNPFGPYTTGYALIPADVTTEAAEEDKYQPPVLGSLAAAQQLNVLTTARISAALAEALAPSYVEVTPETAQQMGSDEDKSPTVREATEIPVIPGKIKRVDSPTTDLDKADERLLADVQQSQFAEVLEGGAASEATGHRLAIQVAQADVQLVPYQNSRADAIKELMMGCLYAIRKHGLKIYVPTIPDGRRRSGKKVRTSEPASLTPEMADAEFELIVTLGAETPITKFAKWQALADREERGSLGYMTLMEQSDVEDVDDEVIRVFEGKMLKETMTQVIPLTVQLLMQEIQKKLFPPVEEEAGVEGAPAGDLGMETPPETGLAGGGGAAPPGAPQDAVRLPGVNMPVTQTSSEAGPPVPEPVDAAQVMR